MSEGFRHAGAQNVREAAGHQIFERCSLQKTVEFADADGRHAESLAYSYIAAAVVDQNRFLDVKVITFGKIFPALHVCFKPHVVVVDAAESNFFAFKKGFGIRRKLFAGQKAFFDVGRGFVFHNAHPYGTGNGAQSVAANHDVAVFVESFHKSAQRRIRSNQVKIEVVNQFAVILFKCFLIAAIIADKTEQSVGAAGVSELGKFFQQMASSVNF